MTAKVFQLLSGAVFLASAATSAHSLPARAFERAELFASCSGRLEALATHQNGFGVGRYDLTRELVATFELMLDATLPMALEQGVPENQAEKWRSQGWVEMAALLAQANFSFDSQVAERMTEALNDRIAECTSVVLSGGTDLSYVTQTQNPTR
ncbi:MAG: hypothetical protein AB3N23_18270 [Paracoccaceae bacterium]